jgi:quercetin 2,3-dioxygenase
MDAPLNAGFPDHPHRGFETVTDMLAGRMRHRDSAGNECLLQGGGVQWMTAGRGVIQRITRTSRLRNTAPS